jgi:hypothetical protein
MSCLPGQVAQSCTTLRCAVLQETQTAAVRDERSMQQVEQGDDNVKVLISSVARQRQASQVRPWEAPAPALARLVAVVWRPAGPPLGLRLWPSLCGWVRRSSVRVLPNLWGDSWGAPQPPAARLRTRSWAVLVGGSGDAGRCINCPFCGWILHDKGASCAPLVSTLLQCHQREAPFQSCLVVPSTAPPLHFSPTLSPGHRERGQAGVRAAGRLASRAARAGVACCAAAAGCRRSRGR